MHQYHQSEDRVQLTLDAILNAITYGEERMFFPGCPDGARLNAGLPLLPGGEETCRSMSSCLECNRGRDLFLEDLENALGFNVNLRRAAELVDEYAATGPGRRFPTSCSVGSALSGLLQMVRENDDMRQDSPARDGAKAAVRGVLSTWGCQGQTSCASCPNGRVSLADALRQCAG